MPKKYKKHATKKDWYRYAALIRLIKCFMNDAFNFHGISDEARRRVGGIANSFNMWSYRYLEENMSEDGLFGEEESGMFDGPLDYGDGTMDISAIQIKDYACSILDGYIDDILSSISEDDHERVKAYYQGLNKEVLE